MRLVAGRNAFYQQFRKSLKQLVVTLYLFNLAGESYAAYGFSVKPDGVRYSLFGADELPVAAHDKFIIVILYHDGGALMETSYPFGRGTRDHVTVHTTNIGGIGEQGFCPFDNLFRELYVYALFVNGG
jgi:hypothetical protein